MKLKFTLMVTCLLGLAAGSASAITISLSRGSGNPGIIASVGGTSLSAGGYYIAAGTFTNGSGVTEVPTITTDFSSLLQAVAAFDVFASVTAPISGGTVGTITGSFVGTGGATPDTFNSKPIYFLVGNQATAAASTAWGIFSMTTPVSFPANVAAAAGGPLISIGTGPTITPLANAGSVTGNSFALAVPEPSAALLGAFGALGLLRRRRN